jgi:hypothetical protein
MTHRWGEAGVLFLKNEVVTSDDELQMKKGRRKPQTGGGMVVITLSLVLGIMSLQEPGDPTWKMSN